jgi:ferrous iron transport protein A
MANSASFRLHAAIAATPIAHAKGSNVARDLSRVEAHRLVRIVKLDLESDLSEWLRAVGIGEGEGIVVLRRALFGGPIHVRTSSGGEFALHRGLARSITVEEIDTALAAE